MALWSSNSVHPHLVVVIVGFSKHDKRPHHEHPFVGVWHGHSRCVKHPRSFGLYIHSRAAVKLHIQLWSYRRCFFYS